MAAGMRESKTRVVMESLLREMETQRIPIGGRLPSESELMAQFAVSRTTIRQALAALSSDGLVAREQGRGTFRVHPAERRRDGQRSLLVGVWFNWPSGPLYGPILDGIREELALWGYHAVLEGGLAAGAEQQGIRNLIGKNLDGFIVSPSSDPTDDHRPLREILDRRLPLVLIDKRPPGCDADLVTTNSRLGAEQLVSHLLALGHRRIGFVGTAEVSTVEERRQGYRLTMRRHGLLVDPAWMKVSADVYADHGRKAAHELLALAPDRRPTAVFGVNDPIAETVADVARQLGLRVPEDLSVVGFDAAGFDLNEQPWLTTYAQPKARIGQQATLLLMARLEDRESPIQTVLLDGQLRVGESTAPCVGS